MASINLLDLKPTVITRDLSNKYILLAAPQKYGKTTFMCSIPGALILSFEPGLNAHAGVYAQTINTWSELKQVCRELAKPAVREKFTTICWDTIEIAAQLCQDFVCGRAGVQTLSEVPYGKLYKEYEIEFSKTIRSVANLGYGCVFSCHTEIKDIATKTEGAVIERLQPKLDRRAFDIINSLVDIIGIGVMEFDEKGNQHRVLYTTQTPNVWAGNRFTYFPPRIDFSYQAVLDALIKAIEAEAAHSNATIVDKADSTSIEHLSYAQIKEEASALWSKLVAQNPENAAIILKKAEMIFGRKIKLSEITEDQASLFELVLEDMREMDR